MQGPPNSRQTKIVHVGETFDKFADLIVSNHNSFRVLFDEIASVYFT